MNPKTETDRQEADSLQAVVGPLSRAKYMREGWRRLAHSGQLWKLARRGRSMETVIRMFARIRARLAAADARKSRELRAWAGRPNEVSTANKS